MAKRGQLAKGSSQMSEVYGEKSQEKSSVTGLVKVPARCSDDLTGHQ
jgi:hypothetical protein